MKRKLKRITTALAGVLAVVGLIISSNPAAATVPGTNQRISTTLAGAQLSAPSGKPFISANGKNVVFQSSATNVLPSGGAGVFVRNLATGTITRVDVSTAGVIGNDTNYTSPEAISATGRYIVFHSKASNLIDGSTTPTTNQLLYLRDIATSTTTLISQTLSGTISNGGTNRAGGVSSDGRFVAFDSNASNLHPDSSDGSSHLYMLDRLDNSLSIIDRKSDGSVVSNNGTWPPQSSMSCDGSLVVFQSAAAMIVGETTTHVNDYLLDRRGVTDKLTNLTNVANAAATGQPSISCNGDYIGFKSTANNLDPSVSVPYSSTAQRPYIYDRVNGIYHFVAVSTSGTATNVSTCNSVGNVFPCILVSDTGVGAFATDDLSLTGTSGSQVYIRDVNAGTTELITRDSSGVAGNASTGFQGISSDGRITTYSSGSNNLVSSDTNNQYDVFTSLTGY